MGNAAAITLQQTAYKHFMGECKMFVDMQNSDTATHKWANVAWLTGWYMAANCYAVISATLKRHSILACVVLSFKIGSSNLLFRSNLTHFDSSKKNLKHYSVFLTFEDFSSVENTEIWKYFNIVLNVFLWLRPIIHSSLSLAIFGCPTI